MCKVSVWKNSHVDFLRADTSFLSPKLSGNLIRSSLLKTFPTFHLPIPEQGFTTLRHAQSLAWSSHREAVTTNSLGLLVLWKGITYWVSLWFPSHLCGSRFFGSFIQTLVVFKKRSLICIQMQYTQAPSWMALCYAYRGEFRKGACVHKAQHFQCGSWSHWKQNGKNIKSCSETQHIGTGRSGKSSLSLL